MRLTIALLISATWLIAQPERLAWDVLKPGLVDTNPLTRRQAVTATGSIGLDPEAVRLVEAELKDNDSLIRATAAAELGEMKSRQSFPLLKAALDDPAGEVGYAAAKALWDMGDKTGRGFLEHVVAGQQNATDGGVKGALHRANRLRYDPKAMAVLGAKSASGALLGPFNIGVLAAEQVFKNAANADGKTWAEKATAAKALSDSNAAVRFMSAAAIIRLSGEQRGAASASHAP